MKLSKKCEYACLALIKLSQNYNVCLTKASTIAEEKNIPKKFLEQILTILKSSNYIYSERGPLGGYQLTKSPSEISLAEIIRLFDGPLAATSSVSTYYYKESPIQSCEKISNVLKDIRDYVANTIENTYFSDLV